MKHQMNTNPIGLPAVRPSSRHWQKLLLAAWLLFSVCPVLWAATDSWTGSGTNGNWGTAGNWSPAAVPAAGDTVKFASATFTNANEPNLNANYTIGQITMNATTKNVTFSAGGGVLTIGLGINARLNTAYAFTLAANSQLGASQSWLNSNSLPSTISGTVNLNSQTLTIGGTGNTIISGAITNNGSLVNSGPGTLTLSGANTYSGNTVVAGGTLLAGAAGVIPSGANAGNVSLTGTLDLNGYNQLINGLGGAGWVTNNGATGAVLTVGAHNATASFVGSLADGASALGFTKTGAGVQTLSGLSTYSGITTVNAGTLILGSAWNGSGAVIVNDGGTLGVVPAAQGAVLDVSSLTFGTSLDSTNTFNLGGFAYPVTAVENVTGALTLNGTVIINVSGTGAAGSIPLISWGSLGGTGGFQIGTLPQGYAGVLATNGNVLELTLTVSLDPLSWRGELNHLANGDWVTNAPSVHTNWYDSLLHVRAGYVDGSPVQFDDTLTGTNSVNLPGIVQPTSIVVNNVTNNYGFSGLGGIISPSGLTKSGTGTLTIGTSNNFSGSVSINGGILLATNSAALGTTTAEVVVTNGAALQLAGSINIEAPPLVLNGTGVSLDGALRSLSGSNTYGGALTLGEPTQINSDAGTLTLASGNPIVDAVDLTVGGNGNVTFADSLTSLTSLTLNGNGTVTLLGVNTYSGPTIINSGTLDLGTGGPNFTLGTGNVVDNGTLVFFLGGTANWKLPTTITGNGTLVLAGTGLQQQSTYVFSQPFSGFNGPVIINNSRVAVKNPPTPLGAGSITINRGGEIYIQSAGFYTNTFNIAGNGWSETAAPTGIGAIRLSSGTVVAGPVNLLGSARLSAYSASGVISGIIDDGTNTFAIEVASVTGNGTLIFSATNTYKGGTTVSSGTLLVDGVLAAAGTVTVATNATLGGSGTVGGSTIINAGGTVSPGDAAGILGTLTFSRNLTLNSGATAQFVLNTGNTPSTNDYLAVAGNLNVTNSILTVTNLGPDLVAGNSFTLLSQPTSGFTIVNLPALDPGLVWANNLAVNGSIQVLAAPPSFPAGAVTVLADGNIILTATGTAGEPYTLWAGTNLAAPATNGGWTVLGSGTITESPFTIIDLTATNYPKRFYLFSTP